MLIIMFCPEMGRAESESYKLISRRNFGGRGLDEEGFLWRMGNREKTHPMKTPPLPTAGICEPQAR
jgi:hypothetical protein